jgi:hypothetical protein
MSHIHVWFGASLCIGLAVACGQSSSSSNGPAKDAGHSNDSSVAPDSGGSTANTCSLIGGAGSCGMGNACCVMLGGGGGIGGLLGGAGGAGGGLAGGLGSFGMGSCVPAGTCSGGISIECGSATNCGASQLCCMGTPTPDAGPDAAVADAGGMGGFPGGGMGGFPGGGMGGFLGGGGLGGGPTAAMHVGHGVHWWENVPAPAALRRHGRGGCGRSRRTTHHAPHGLQGPGRDARRRRRTGLGEQHRRGHDHGRKYHRCPSRF